MLELKNLCLHLGNFSLKNVSFNVNRGDYFILLGVSGAGKSMILETIAGLDNPGSGSIILDGKEIIHEKIQNRGVGLVFQDHAVFPHMTVRENIAYSLHGNSLSHHEKTDRIDSVAGQFDILSLLDRRPATLSGGELQRVALARTLVQQPKVLLLDEPLASLDIQLRSELRGILRRLNRTGQTIIHVTHDYEEALSLATRIAVINLGKIVQEGTPAEVFHHPKSEFVANFIGVKNFFPAVLVKDNGAIFAILDKDIHIRVVHDEPGCEGFILIRGEDILLSNEPVETSAMNNFIGQVTEVVPTSSGMDIVIDVGVEIHSLITNESCIKMGIKEGGKCWVHFKATAVKFIRN